MSEQDKLLKKKKVSRKRKRKKRAQAGRPPKKPFPSLTFEDVILYAETIQQLGAGHKVRREEVFKKLGKSSKSSTSNKTTTQSNFYGLTTGSYVAEHVELTEKGKLATNPEESEDVKQQARFELAIIGVQAFKILYDEFKDNRLPDQSVLRDILKEKRIA